MPDKWLVAGLGNPGREYAGTKHNIGFWLLDTLAVRHGMAWQSSARFSAEIAQVSLGQSPCLLMKPQLFMNRSGQPIGDWCRFHQHPPARIVVVYDDINLLPGRSKVSVGGSAGGHNGIRDILNQLDNTFVRYRIGIGGKPHREMDLADHVLGPVSADDQAMFNSRLDDYIADLTKIIQLGPEQAAITINQSSKIS